MSFHVLSDPIERVATQRTLILLFVSWLGVAVIAGTGLYLAEVGINPNVNEPIDALWWATVTLTTVGYGDVFPVTPDGRLAGAGLMIIGITLFAAITATITSNIIRSQEPKADEGSVGLRLRTRAALHHEGIVTDAEFETKKEDILDRL